MSRHKSRRAQIQLFTMRGRLIQQPGCPDQNTRLSFERISKINNARSCAEGRPPVLLSYIRSTCEENKVGLIKRIPVNAPDKRRLVAGYFKLTHLRLIVDQNKLCGAECGLGQYFIQLFAAKRCGPDNHDLVFFRHCTVVPVEVVLVDEVSGSACAIFLWRCRAYAARAVMPENMYTRASINRTMREKNTSR